ncbi:MAG: hypothetical protein AAFR81_14830 [Chloroflexota bacterium]
MHRVTIILGICLFLLVAIVEAQARWQCEEQIIQDVQWSPDGTRLAVMTLQGVLFYDADMQLQQTVVAPQSIFDQTSLTGIVWSPDSQWVVLPDHVSPDDAERGVQGWSIANAETGELRAILDPFQMSVRSRIQELVWSPDNNFLLALKYPPPFGNPPPYSELLLFPALLDGGFSPVTNRFSDVGISHLRWDETGITGQVEGLQFQFETPELTFSDTFPILRERWWRLSPDGTREAAFISIEGFVLRDTTPDTIEHWVSLFPTVNTTGDILFPAQVSEIVWTTDSQRIVAVYAPILTNNPQVEIYPDMPFVLQGSVVDAVSNIEIHHFFLQDTVPVRQYSVSPSGERVVTVREDGVLVWWHPLTDEKLGEVIVGDTSWCA